jgi:uncharacterized repeat protein (TIGR03803 family)
MHTRQFSSVRRIANAFASTMALMLLMQAAQAQTFSVLHYFTGGSDGEFPFAGVTIGPGGVLYGTTSGSENNDGTVFKLSQVNSSWVFSPLYEFTGGSNGRNPLGGVLIGPNGTLYGTTEYGGDKNNGTVYGLSPPPAFCNSMPCYWNETVLHAFTSGLDGESPGTSLAFDQAGDIYGTTGIGGMYGHGVAFELTPSRGGWAEDILLYTFGYRTDGAEPDGGVVFDTAGNVYGTTFEGGIYAAGTIYRLTPSNGGWVEDALFIFNGANGNGPAGNLVLDASGSLYGAAVGGGRNDFGVIFKLAPSDGGWTYSLLYSFSSFCQPWSGVTMDAAGNIFGACYEGGADQGGWIFELTNCSQTCTLVDLHDFNGIEGAESYGAPVLDADGNLYGTTLVGGTGYGNCDGGCGVVWEIAGVGAPRKESN